MSRRARLPDAGFSLTEMMMVVSIVGILAAIGVPFGIQLDGRMRLNNQVREVERELQTARLKAVTSNRTLQVRFNCPAAGQYRIVEVMNTAIDNTASRCSQATYPVRAVRDNDPATPDYDGPVRYLANQVAFSVTTPVVFQFAPTGVTFQIVSGNRLALGATGANLTMSRGSYTGSVNVNGLGRIRIQ